MRAFYGSPPREHVRALTFVLAITGERKRENEASSRRLPFDPVQGAELALAKLTRRLDFNGRHAT
jgi:hypothetical protein